MKSQNKIPKTKNKKKKTAEKCVQKTVENYMAKKYHSGKKKKRNEIK